jgi:CheY-like chemotaxis protein
MQHADDPEQVTGAKKRQRPTGAEPHTTRSASLGAPPTRDATILIVENEVNNRRLIEQILGFAGYHYLSAANGLEALAVVDRAPVDLVLLDLSMPVLDGYRTTELMRERRDISALPIIAVTAHAMSDDRELALRSGCSDYLTKPFRPAELLGIVERWLMSMRPN